MMGAFPPPVGGAALINARVHDDLMAVGAGVARVDLAGPSLAHSRGLAYHARRALRNMLGLIRARKLATRDTTLYIVPDAGLGAWYTRAHMTAAARRFGAVVIHHHSCRYIEEYDSAIAAVTTVARDIATHVFLTDGMAEAFRRQYGDIAFRVVTNAGFVTAEAVRSSGPRLGGPIRIGHLSNLCADKGFFVAADTFDAVRAAGFDATLELAGPILEQAVQERIDALVAEHGEAVRYRGELAGQAKLDFYRNIELFVFPTAFKQEAAPLVIYEALAAGTAVIATDRGLIAEIVPEFGGAVCERDGPFAECVVTYLNSESWTEEARAGRAAAIKEWMRNQCAISTAQRESLISQLASRAGRG